MPILWFLLAFFIVLTVLREGFRGILKLVVSFCLAFGGFIAFFAIAILLRDSLLLIFTGWLLLLILFVIICCLLKKIWP